MHADNEEGNEQQESQPETGQEIEAYGEIVDDPGFIAFDRHLDKLQMLLTVWTSLIEKPLSDPDELVADEIRHQIKRMLTETTHDMFLKAMTLNSMGIGDES